MQDDTQVVADDELEDLAAQIVDRLGVRYGSVVFKVKDRQVVAIDVNRSFHTRPRNGRT